MTTLTPTASWAEMTAEEKRESRVQAWLSAPGVEFASPETEAAYKARVTRFMDCIELKKIPDRVPVCMNASFMPMHLYGVTPYTAMYEPEGLTSTFRQFLVDYQPDYYYSPALAGDGRVLEALDYKQYAWPGHGVAKESIYQYVESDYMTTEDYEALIDDPSDFYVRRFLPRICGALAGLEKIPPFTDLWEVVLVSGHMVPFGLPDVQNALKALMDAGDKALAWIQHIGAIEMEVRGLGYVNAAGGISKAPFDILADTLRGTRATMIDLHRHPDLILKAIERITPLAIKQGVSGASSQVNPIVFMPLHKGADGFMSDEQFRTFYWPSLKAVVLGLIEEGCVPCLFCEGGYNSRLEYLAELPKGTTLCVFDRTDMTRAKEILGGTVCIGGNVPSGLVLTGTAEQMTAYCKDLIEKAAPGGGFMVAFGTAMDEGKPDTVRAMIEATREYGVYS